MLKINKSKNNLRKSSELEIFLSTGMEVFSTNNTQKQNKKIKKKIDTNEKIDELIANYETIKKSKDTDNKEQKNTKPYLEFVEIRKSIEKKPKTKEFNGNEKNIKNEQNKKIFDETKEITFNIKEDKSDIKELTFNIEKNKEKIQKMGEPDSKKRKNKRFSLFKSKKNEKKKNPKNKESDIINQNLNKEKIKSKNKNKFLSKNKDADKENPKKDKIKKQKIYDNNETIEKENTFLDEDIKKVLLITDNLLEKLPEDVINEFIKSKDFELYERVINKIK